MLLVVRDEHRQGTRVNKTLCRKIRAMSVGYIRFEILFCGSFSCTVFIAWASSGRDKRITFIAPPALVLKSTLYTGRAVGYILIAADLTDATFNAACILARPTDLGGSLLAYLPFAGYSHCANARDRGKIGVFDNRVEEKSGVTVLGDRDRENRDRLCDNYATW